MELIKKDTLLGQKRKDWHESLSKDAYVEEAINVLSDIKKPVVASKDKVLNIKNRKDKLVKS